MKTFMSNFDVCSLFDKQNFESSGDSFFTFIFLKEYTFFCSIYLLVCISAFIIIVMLKCFPGSILLESKIQQDTAYQKQQVYIFVCLKPIFSLTFVYEVCFKKN